MFSPSVVVKTAYAKIMQSIAKATKIFGLYGILERYKHKRFVHWLLSLGAIHDLDAMISLDVPWWSYNAIDRVDQFLKENPNSHVLEYGSGSSTVWLSKRAAQVTSVEHHKGWYDMLVKKPEIAKNVVLLLREGKTAQGTNGIRSQKPGSADLDFTDYVNAAFEAGRKYDVIVIDGRAREACLEVANSVLAEGGLIIFDNSTRKRYQDGINSTKGRALRLKGMVPSLPYPDETTLISFPSDS